MSLYEGEFYKTLIEWTEGQYSEVQYNCAGILGHIAIDSTFIIICLMYIQMCMYHMYFTYIYVCVLKLRVCLCVCVFVCACIHV